MLITERYFEIVARVTREKLEPPASGFALRATTRQVDQGAKNAKLSYRYADRQKKRVYQLQTSLCELLPDKSLRGHCRYLRASRLAICGDCPQGWNPFRIVRFDSEKIIFLCVLCAFAVSYLHGFYSTP